MRFRKKPGTFHRYTDNIKYRGHFSRLNITFFFWAFDWTIWFILCERTNSYLVRRVLHCLQSMSPTETPHAIYANLFIRSRPCMSPLSKLIWPINQRRILEPRKIGQSTCTYFLFSPRAPEPEPQQQKNTNFSEVVITNFEKKNNSVAIVHSTKNIKRISSSIPNRNYQRRHSANCFPSFNHTNNNE